MHPRSLHSAIDHRTKFTGPARPICYSDRTAVLLLVCGGVWIYPTPADSGFAPILYGGYELLKQLRISRPLRYLGGSRLHTRRVPMGRTSGCNRGSLGQGVPPDEPIKNCKISEKKILSLDFRAPDHHHTIPRVHTNNVSSGHFLARGSNKGARGPQRVHI